MKKFTFYRIAGLTIFSMVLSASGMIAQGLCNSPLAVNQKLKYKRIDHPDILFNVTNYANLKGKKKEDAEKKFDQDVKDGKIKATESEFDMRVSEVITRKNGSLSEIEFASGANKYYSYILCANDTLFGIRNKKATPLLDSKKDTTGFMILGINQYPMNMKVGDVLPATTDLFYTFPEKVDASYKKQVIDQVVTTTNTWEDRDYVYTNTRTDVYYKEVTMKLNYTLQFSAPTITYRHVVGEEELEIGGKKYKALKIELSLETKLQDMITNVNADEMLVKWCYEFTNKFIVNKVNKSELLKNGGYEWFVPELGLIVQSQIVDAGNRPLYTTVIKSVQ